MYYARGRFGTITKIGKYSTLILGQNISCDPFVNIQRPLASSSWLTIHTMSNNRQAILSMFQYLHILAWLCRSSSALIIRIPGCNYDTMSYRVVTLFSWLRVVTGNGWSLENPGSKPNTQKSEALMGNQCHLNYNNINCDWSKRFWRGHYRGPFCGLPIHIQDLGIFCNSGIPGNFPRFSETAGITENARTRYLKFDNFGNLPKMSRSHRNCRKFPDPGLYLDHHWFILAFWYKSTFTGVPPNYDFNWGKKVLTSHNPSEPPTTQGVLISAI